jgi:hypothetical protein
VALSVVAAAALSQWPYGRACGLELVVYLLAVTTVVVAGIWGAMVSWQARLASAHVIALGTILWGLALIAHEAMPRVGYITSPATWWCGSPQSGIRPSAPVGSSPAARPPV